MSSEKAPDMKEFLDEIQQLSSNNKKENIMTKENQLERLLSQKFQNPYDVLLLKAEAPEEEIRKQYRIVNQYQNILIIPSILCLISILLPRYRYSCIQIKTKEILEPLRPFIR
jgi:hypothetical protein